MTHEPTGNGPRRTDSSDTPLDIQGIAAQVQAAISEAGGIEIAAAHLGMRPSTLQKVLEGRALSTPCLRKLTQRLVGDAEQCRSEWPRQPLVTRLNDTYRLYKFLGTLEAVGQKMGITRERVRQLLKQGTRLGLFEYSGREYPYVSRADLLRAYKKTGSITKAARLCRVSEPYYRRLLTGHSITPQRLHRIRRLRGRRRCVRLYQRIAARLGHPPNTFELQSTRRGHSLHSRILRLWGSIDAFREELKIPTPPRGNPRFHEHMAAWREEQHRIAVVRRLQDLDDIRDCLRAGPMSLTSLAEKCDLKRNRVVILLQLLRNGREVIQLGQGYRVTYQLKERHRE